MLLILSNCLFGRKLICLIRNINTRLVSMLVCAALSSVRIVETHVWAQWQNVRGVVLIVPRRAGVAPRI